MKKYANRVQAGRILATSLAVYKNHPDVLVLALPRGGVPIGYEIAKALSTPLDIFLVRKLGVPTHQELAMGAIATGGAIVFNDTVIKELKISPEMIKKVIQIEQKELQRRELTYRHNKTALNIKDKVIILVDDGIATGATAKAALTSLQHYQPKCLILAVPVAAPETIIELSDLADAVICPLQPENFSAVGNWYEEFEQTTDEEVFALLQ